MAESQRGFGNVPREQHYGGIRVQFFVTVSVTVAMVVSVAPSGVVSGIVSLPCPPSCPPDNFDGKPACRQHKSLASLLSRPCWGEQQTCCQNHSNAIAGHFVAMYVLLIGVADS